MLRITKLICTHPARAYEDFFSFLFTTIIQLQITAEVTIYNGNTTTQQNDAIMHATFDTTICLNYSKTIVTYLTYKTNTYTTYNVIRLLMLLNFFSFFFQTMQLCMLLSILKFA